MTKTKKYPCQRSITDCYKKNVNWSHLKPVPFKICTKDPHTCEEKEVSPSIPEKLREKLMLKFLGKPERVKIDGVWKTVFVMKEDDEVIK
jgi:hypothetical protein